MLKSFANMLHGKLSAQPAWLIHGYLLPVSLAEAFSFSQEYFDWFPTWNGSSPAEDAEVASARTT